MLEPFLWRIPKFQIICDELKANNIEDLYEKWNGASLRKKRRICKRIIKSYIDAGVPSTKWIRMKLYATEIPKFIDSVDTDIKFAYALRSLKSTTETKPINIDKLI